MYIDAQYFLFFFFFPLPVGFGSGSGSSSSCFRFGAPLTESSTETCIVSTCAFSADEATSTASEGSELLEGILKPGI